MEAGTRIGDYEIIGPLGAGAYAVVYDVRHIESGERFAMKLLERAGGPSEEDVLRFKREYKAMARMEHPRLVRVHGEGSYRDPEDPKSWRPYLVMDRIEGQSLAEHAPSLMGLPVETRCARVVSLAAQICEGLAHIHNRQVVHRDLKPGNVLIDRLGQARLMDFGIARLESEAENLTRAGALVGTLAYISPEQALGKAIDGRADLYALGVVLYELLTGQRPFDADDPVAFLYQHTREPPQPPRNLEPALPEALEAVVLRLLAKAPDERFPDAIAARGALVAAYHADSVVDLDPNVTAPIDAPPTVAEAPALLTPPLVGREPQLRRLEGALGRAAAGQGSAWRLVGDVGNGKSRLADEIASKAASGGAIVLRARCHARSGRAFAPFRQLMEQAAAALRLITRGEPPAELASLYPMLATSFRSFGTLTEIPEAIEATGVRRSLVGAVTRVLEYLAENGPLVMIVEDRQWADEASQAALVHLASRVTQPGVRALLIVTEQPGARPEIPGADPLTLGPLDAETSLAMASGMLGGAELPPAFAERVHALSGGNPRLIAELVRHLEGEEQSDTQSLEDLVPGSVRDLLRARLEGLDAAEHLVLEGAAVVGAPVGTSRLFDLLHETQPEALPELEALLGGIQNLTRKGILTADPGGMRHVIANPALVEIVYGEIPPARRIALHAAFAATQEPERARLDARELADLAHHYMEGKQPAAALGPLLDATERILASGASGARALEVLDDVESVLRRHPNPEAAAGAGRLRIRAALRDDDLEAAGLGLETYFARAHDGETWRSRLHATHYELLRGEVALRRRDKATAKVAFEAALALTDPALDGDGLDRAEVAALNAHALVGLGTLAVRRGDLTAATNAFADVQVARSLVRGAASSDWSALEAEAEAGLGLIHLYRSELSVARDRSLHAFELSRSAGDLDRAVSALLVASEAEALQGLLGPALSAAREAGVLARLHELPERLCEARLRESATLLELNLLRAAWQAATPLEDPRAEPMDREAFDQASGPAVDWYICCLRGRITSRRQPGDGFGVELLREGLRQLRDIGGGPQESSVLSWLSSAELDLGNVEAAAKDANASLRLAEELDQRLAIVEARLAVTAAARAAGDNDAALVHALEALSVSRERELRVHQLAARVHLAELGAGEEHWEAAGRLAHKIREGLEKGVRDALDRRPDMEKALAKFPIPIS